MTFLHRGFEVIQTHFDGYHFRSRLEARHALLYNLLEQTYTYEKEGYSFEGVCYLPDFWLSSLMAWTEIKGDLPTLEEIWKARMLAFHTGYPVFILSGSFPLLEKGEKMIIRGEYPPIPKAGWMKRGLLRVLPPSIQQMRQTFNKIKHALWEEKEWTGDFSEVRTVKNLEWAECSACQHIAITQDQQRHTTCPSDPQGIYHSYTPRLCEAFRAARSERFEKRG